MSKLIYINKGSNFEIIGFLSVQSKCWVSCDWKTAPPLSGEDVSAFRWRSFLRLDVLGALSEVLGRKDRATLLHRQHCQPEAHKCTFTMELRAGDQSQEQSLCSERGTFSWDSSHCWKQDIWDKSTSDLMCIQTLANAWVNLQLVAASR